ncbi:MAG: bL17 family ribosomal protein [Candidatus Borkfalkiaceae bacterium]|nr:bL17 family ribosomal protein [Christensenellaceae bacterium]
MARKLGVNATQRIALLKNQATNLLWHGKIETTEARAKEVASYVSKILTLAVNTYTDTVETEVTVKDAKGKETKKTLLKDGNKKLNARRKIMSMVNDVQEVKGFKESKADFKKRTEDIKYPLIEKIFDEYAPKYASRKEEKGQGGGYTAIYKLGPRKGDAAEVAIITLVD